MSGKTLCSHPPRFLTPSITNKRTYTSNITHGVQAFYTAAANKAHRQHYKQLFSFAKIAEVLPKNATIIIDHVTTFLVTVV
jgi:hypothetical protein